MSVNVMEILGAARRGGFRGLGELTRHPEVGRLQRRLNVVKLGYVDWTPGADIGEDDKYGATTHARLRSFVRYATRRVPVISACAGTGTDELDRSGPAAVGPCIARALFYGETLSDADLSAIEAAWTEWKAAGAVRENDRPVSTNPPGADGTPGPLPPEEPGLSTGWKIAIGLGIVAAIAAIAWMIWGDEG